MVNRTLIAAGIIIAIVIVAVGSVSRQGNAPVVQRTVTTTQASTTIPQTVSQTALRSCGSNYSLFSTPIFNPNSVVSVLPIADFIPPDHVFPTPHAYVYTTDITANISKDGALLYAPANMVLTDIAIRNLRNTFGVYKNATDYTLVFQPCKEFYLYFHNVASLSYQPFIKASLQLMEECNNQIYCEMPVDIRISAGQVIGTIGNSSAGIQGVDIGARDYRLATGRSAFVDPNRLCPLQSGQPNIFDRCYAVCPYNYYANSIKQQSRLFYPNGSTIASCGTVYQDVNGTAQGYWFPADNSANSISPEATYIFLGNDTASTTSKVFSVGVSVAGLTSGAYSFKPNPNPSSLVNKSFANVTPGRVYCYQTLGKYYLSGNSSPGPTVIIAIKMTNASELSIQRLNGTSCGSGPWVIGTTATKFVR
ncbi:MAG: hypothetical protein KGH94_02970 [Candidatus Micrarchaeota archaeon]|nr:hypothetical protein [Candidatus Micrarchaeota archaeon]